MNIKLKNVTRHVGRLSFAVEIDGDAAGLGDLFIYDEGKKSEDLAVGGSGAWLELEGAADEVAELAIYILRCWK